MNRNLHLWAAPSRERTSTTARNSGRTAVRPWAVAVWLLIWQGAAMAMAAAWPNGHLLLASPWAAAVRLVQLALTASFWMAVGNSCLRIFGGFLLACVLACAMAALAARFRLVRELLAPPVAAVKAVPVVSFIILALVWLNARSLPMFIAGLMVFPPVYLNVLTGIGAADAQLLEMARVFRVPFGRQVRAIYLPAVLPYFRTAVSLSLGLCWKAGAAAEIIGLPAGTIGERLYMAKVYYQTPDLFAWTLVIVAMAAVIERVILRAVDAAAERMGA